VLSAVAHNKVFIFLKTPLKDSMSSSPGRPFDVHKSGKLLKAYKDGNVLLVNYMLQSNK